MSGTGGYSAPSSSSDGIPGFSNQGASAFSEFTNRTGRWQPPCEHMKVKSACRRCSPKPGQAARAEPQVAQEPQERDEQAQEGSE